MRRLGPVILASATLLLAPGSAAASVHGSASGVSLRYDRGDLIVAFHRSAAARFRLIAGREIDVSCEELTSISIGFTGIKFTDGAEVNDHAPRARRPFRVDIGSAKDSDYCEIRRARFRRRTKDGFTVVPSRLVAAVPLTKAGRIYVDEHAKAVKLTKLLGAAGLLATERGGAGYPDAEEIARRSHGDVVALPTPQATPPPGQLGYFSNGAAHVAAVTLSAAGKRLYVELDGDRLITDVNYPVFE